MQTVISQNLLIQASSKVFSKGLQAKHFVRELWYTYHKHTYVLYYIWNPFRVIIINAVLI